MKRLSGVLVALLVSGCSHHDANGPLTIMASPLPHTEILEYVEQHFKDAPRLKIIQIDGQTDPNEPLASGDIDANYFEHGAFLAADQVHISVPLVSVASVHLEPLGLYSSRHHSLAALPDGARIGIPNNPTNYGRGLMLLQQQGLISLKQAPGGNSSTLTEQDITANPHHIKLIPTDAPLLARALADFDGAIINGNFALEAGLSPAHDALALESVKDNPYANLLVVRKSERNDPRIKKLAAELSSPDVARFIANKYQGAVVPVHSTTDSAH